MATLAPDATSITDTNPYAGMRRRHWEMLVLSIVVVILAPLMEIHPDQRVGVAGLSWCSLPGLCLSREIFNMDCPACGLTRSLILFAHGHLTLSWRMHHVGWAMAILILLQLPYRTLCLTSNRQILGKTAPKIIGQLMIAALIGNWIIGLITQ